MVAKNSKVFDMVNDLYYRTNQDCTIPISFTPAGGVQQNDCLDELVALTENPSKARAKLVANRLQSITNVQSGLGLLFIAVGKEGNLKKLLVTRFPADQGVTAEQKAGQLDITFVERVFLKNTHAYKSVVYEGQVPATDFWKGMAVDKQAGSKSIDLAQYWIKNFLLSDFQTTPQAGSQRLARLLRKVVDSTSDLTVKQEIAAAVMLTGNLNNTPTSVEQFTQQFSEETRNLILSSSPNQAMNGDQFQFDIAEFKKLIAYRAIELDSGVTVSAMFDQFDENVVTERLDGGMIRLSSEGLVTNDILRKRK